MVQAGKTNKLIDILQPDNTSNNFGEVIYQWTTFISRPIWADVQPISGQEFLDANQTMSLVNLQFNLRYSTEFIITPDYRILYNSKQYNIRSVINLNEENRELQLFCDKVTT